ncbi:MAG: undecaprenyl-diphosphatase UppP [Candidatus Paceibacterota bacterium]
MSTFSGVILGFVQGITEFLPVSSTGHLVLIHSLFGAGEYDLAFDAVLHLATILAVVIYFHKDLLTIANAVLRKLSRLPVNKKEIRLAYALMIGTVPAVIVGLLLESYMEAFFRQPLLVAGFSVAGSILFMYAEWRYLNEPRHDKITIMKGLYIGLFQCLALLPGMSRSGMTLVGGMLMGLTRSEAARFSFLLAIPIIAGSGLKKLIDLRSADIAFDWGTLALATTVAFIAALLAIHFMLAFVRRYTLWPFIWYRVILAALIVLVVYLA